MSSLRLYLHVGLPKTGTTFLQSEVFPRMQGVKVLRAFHPFRTLGRIDVPERLILSDESLYGSPIRSNWREQRRRATRVLRDVFGDVPVLIGFRRHPEFVLSLYKQYLQLGGVRAIGEYFSSTDPAAILKPDDLGFEEILAELHASFSRVFVYTQEELNDDFEGFLRSLCSFLDVPPLPPERVPRRYRNRGVRGRPQAALLRRLNELNQVLERIPGVPSADNPLFRRLKVTPRDIGQRYLRWLPGRKLDLPRHERCFLERDFARDWQLVERKRGSVTMCARRNGAGGSVSTPKLVESS